MKCRIERDDLHDALSAVKPAVGKDHPAVLLSTFDGGKTLTVAADDRDLAISVQSACFQPEQATGSIMVPFKPLADMVARLHAGAVDLVAEGPLLQLQSGPTHMDLPADGTELPHRPELDDEPVKFTLNDWDDIQAVAVAASAAHAKPALVGVHFGPDGVTATDGYRMHHMALESGLDVLAPARVVASVRSEGDVAVACDERSVQVTAGDVTLRSSAIAAEFPIQFLDRLHVGPVCTLTVDGDELAEAVARVAITSTELTDRGRMLNFTPVDSGEVVIASRQDEHTVGTATEALGVETDCEFGFGLNSRYLLDAIRFLGEGDVTLELTDHLALVNLRRGRLVAGLMPVRYTT